MENKETKDVKEIKDYKEERFEFTLYVNDNIICKRNFKIYNFIEGSMNTYDFKETLDEVVRLIDNDLKSKSRVYTWFYFNPNSPNDCEELISPTIEPWSCTFKIVVSDNKKEVISKIWDGYAYPKFIRDKVDLSNKNVKITNRDGQTFMYDKESFFKSNENRLSFEHEVLKAMIMDKQDVLLQITKKICEACSPAREDVKGFIDQKESAKFLSDYTTYEEYGNGKKGGKKKKYAYSLYLANKKVEDDWRKITQKKTEKYFKNLF